MSAYILYAGFERPQVKFLSISFMSISSQLIVGLTVGAPVVGWLVGVDVVGGVGAVGALEGACVVGLVVL